MNWFEIVEAAHVILKIDQELKELRRENRLLKEIKKAANESIRDNLRSAQETSFGILKLLMVPGIPEAIENFTKDKHEQNESVETSPRGSTTIETGGHPDPTTTNPSGSTPSSTSVGKV